MADDERIGGFLPPRAGEPRPAPSPETTPPPPAARVAGQTRATVALMCGVLGLVLLPPLFSSMAIVLGRRARAELEAGGARQGVASARTAVVLGWLGLAGFVLLLVLLGTGTIEVDDLGLRRA